jgi:hypothetical protein
LELSWQLIVYLVNGLGVGGGQLHQQGNQDDDRDGDAEKKQ